MLRNKLSQVNWGRNELSLPLFAEEKKEDMRSTVIPSSGMIPDSSPIASFNRMEGSSSNSNSHQHQIIKIDSQNSFQGMLIGDYSRRSHLTLESITANSRRPLLAREPPIGSDLDRDDNKYKQKTPLEMLNRWTRRFYSPSSRPPWRRTWFLVLVGILMFLLLIYIMAKLGRGDSDEDFEDFRHNR